MNRLTYKLNEQEQEEHKTKYLKFEYFPIPDYCLEKGNSGRITSDMIYNKLGKLEDLEEEIGCPLEVYVKLHQQMKFYRLNALNEIIECEIDNPNDDEVYHIQTDGIIFNQYDYGWQFYPFKDYKKTWWLKENREE